MPPRSATVARLLVAAALSLLAVALLVTLVLVAVGAGQADGGGQRAGLAFGWVTQAVLTVALLAALPFVWRWVGRPERERAWREREPEEPVDDGRRHRGLSGEEPPPVRW